MGGYGSTRWANHDKADTVEDALVLGVADLVRLGLLLQEKVMISRSIVWTSSRTKETTASVFLDVDTLTATPPFVRFRYQENGNPKDYRVLLDSTRPPFGGLRWWWRCPAMGCGKRAGKLYLPSGGGIFACRTCHRLTYESAQEHDARVDALARRGLEGLSRMPVEGASLGSILLSLKAEAKVLKKLERRASR